VDRLRFAIETTDRQMHQARIRTSTRDPLLRLLDVGVALALRNVWVWFHERVLARPRRGGRRTGPLRRPPDDGPGKAPARPVAAPPAWRRGSGSTRASGPPGRGVDEPLARAPGGPAPSARRGQAQQVPDVSVAQAGLGGFPTEVRKLSQRFRDSLNRQEVTAIPRSQGGVAFGLRVLGAPRRPLGRESIPMPDSVYSIRLGPRPAAISVRTPRGIPSPAVQTALRQLAYT
jgi:hypothetical protein